MVLSNVDEAAIFNAARQIQAPDDRRLYLQHACGGDKDLQARVEALLRVYEEEETFLKSPTEEIRSILGAPMGEGPGTQIGRYKLLQLIGEGGMGTVFLAEQSQPVKRKVALKIIRPGLDLRQVIARFEAERQALALMDHPNVAKVFDAGTISGEPGYVGAGRPYFVMELVQGSPITQYCDAHHLTLAQRLKLFVPVCEAVQHAHQKGIIHRDLKPSNVLIALYDGRPIPKIIDFGVAKAIGPKLTEETLQTEFGSVVGTLEYMSPEQAEPGQLDIDTRSDIYSLGVMLYELLTGTTPLRPERRQGAALLDLLRLVREGEPPTPSTRLCTTEELPGIAANRGLEPKKLVGLVQGELDWIVMKCLEKDRTRRYETANALARDVERYLQDEPVEACPPSAWYKLRKFASKNRKLLGAAGAFAILLTAGIIVSTWLAVRATRAEQAARKALTAEAGAKRRTRQALDEMSSQVVDNWLKRQPGKLEPKQVEFLQKALAYYREFAQESGNSEEIRSSVAKAHGRVGGISRKLGQHELEEQAYRSAVAYYQQLAADFPSQAEYRQELAATYNQLGIMLQYTGRPQEAEEAHRHALTLLKQLTTEFPAVPGYRRTLAAARRGLAFVLRDNNRLKEADEAFRDALALQKELAAEFPAEPEYREELSTTYNDLGIVLRLLGRSSDAERSYRDAIALEKQLVADFPAEPGYRQHLTRSYNNQGIVLRESDRPKEAEEAYRDALTVKKQLTAEFPAVPQLRQELAMSYSNLGNLLRSMGRAKEAEETLREALTLHKQLAAELPNLPDYSNNAAGAMVNLALLLRDLEDYSHARELLEGATPYHQAALRANSRNPTYREFFQKNRVGLASVLAGLGDHSAVAQVAEQLATLGWEPASDVYAAARALARCIPVTEKNFRLDEAERQQLVRSYRDRALVRLREAIAKGYSDAAGMRRDKDLVALQAHPDFQKLLTDLEDKVTRRGK